MRAASPVGERAAESSVRVPRGGARPGRDEAASEAAQSILRSGSGAGKAGERASRASAGGRPPVGLLHRAC